MTEQVRQATAREVAVLAGVSAQTVSRVANGAENVRAATRERVVAAMEQVGYQPNSAARALRSGRADTIGVVAHHVSRTGEARILEAVIAAAHAGGLGVTVADASNGGLEHLQAAVSSIGTRVAGLVVLGLETTDVAALGMPPRLPVVVADSRALPFPTVGLDQSGGAHLAVAHLLGLGHRTVHHVTGPRESLQARQREDAWRTTLAAAGRDVPAPLAGDWTPASGYAAGQQLAADPAVTAVFVANDEMAAGVLRALHEAGRAVPADVSVIGFDDVIAEYLWPPLTTVRQDFSAIGEQLVATLAHRIAAGNGPAHTGRETAHETAREAAHEVGLVQPTLVTRASCAPPRGAATSD